MVVLWLKKNFRAKFGPNLDLSPNYFCLQIHFLDCYSSVFFRVAYYDRQQWYLADSGGISCWKNFWPIFRAFLGPNLVQNLVFGSKLDVDSYNLSDITHSDFIQWFLNYYWCYLRLTPQKGIFGVKNLFKNLVFSLYLDIFSFFYFLTCLSLVTV